MNSIDDIKTGYGFLMEIKLNTGNALDDDRITGIILFKFYN